MKKPSKLQPWSILVSVLLSGLMVVTACEAPPAPDSALGADGDASAEPDGVIVFAKCSSGLKCGTNNECMTGRTTCPSGCKQTVRNNGGSCNGGRGVCSNGACKTVCGGQNQPCCSSSCNSGLWCEGGTCRVRIAPGGSCDPEKSDSQCAVGGCRQANKCCAGSCTVNDPCLPSDTCATTGKKCPASGHCPD